MASKINVPDKVKKHLSADEEVIRRFSSMWKEFYVTNQRLIGFERPDWLVLFFIIGLLPGILAILFTKRTYFGAVEYSRISGISNVRWRTILMVALGLIIGVPLIIMGLVILSTAPEPGGGWLSIILGAFALLALWYGRPSVYQVNIRELPQKESRKWVFAKLKGFGGRNAADELAQIIKEKAGG